MLSLIAYNHKTEAAGLETEAETVKILPCGEAQPRGTTSLAVNCSTVGVRFAV